MFSLLSRSGPMLTSPGMWDRRMSKLFSAAMKNSLRIKDMMWVHFDVPEFTQLTTAVLSQWNLTRRPVSCLHHILHAVTIA